MAWTCQALSHIALRARLSLLYLLREPIDRQVQLCYRLPTAWSREEKQTRRCDRTGCQIHQQPLVATTHLCNNAKHEISAHTHIAPAPTEARRNNIRPPPVFIRPGPQIAQANPIVPTQHPFPNPIAHDVTLKQWSTGDK